MVNMTDSTYVYMWLGSVKFLFSHFVLPLFRAHHRIRTDDPILTKNVLYRLSYVGVGFIIQIFITICLYYHLDTSYGGGSRIRTCVALRAADLQSAPIGRSGIPPDKTRRTNPAREGIRTPNLPITNRLRCRCATRAPDSYNIN